MADFMVYIKIHDTDNGSMVAMCDEQLIDKVLSEGDIVIDIKAYNSFYKGSKVSKPVAIDMVGKLDHIYSANVIGDESIEIALSLRIIDKKGIMRIGKVPYAHAYSMD